MSPRVGSFRITNRAKCSCANSPNGRAGCAIGHAGAEFIVASSARSAGSPPAAIGATTVNCDCGVTSQNCQAEVDQPVLVPIHLAEIEAGRSDGSRRGCGARGSTSGVVENDTFLAIQPARAFVDLGEDASRPNASIRFFSTPLAASNTFPASRSDDDLGNGRRVVGAGRDDGRSIGGAVGNVACGFARTVHRAALATSPGVGLRRMPLLFSILCIV